MITQIRGILRSVAEESLILGVEPFFDLEVLIPEYARRQLQAKVDERVVLHTVFDIEGNQMSGRMKPRLIGFLSPVDREFFEVFCSVDGVGVRKALRAMVRPVRELARMIQDSGRPDAGRPSRASARRRPSGSSPSSGGRSASSP